MHLNLERDDANEMRTLGKLSIGDAQFFTVELPWIENPHGPGGLKLKSCVPAGAYTVRPHTSRNFPNTYALTNPDQGVWYQPGDMPKGQQWGRSAILIHVGNTVKDIRGCIAVGMERYEHGVLRSGVAMRELNRLLGRERHTLEIT